MKKAIHIAASPNTQKDDLALAKKLLRHSSSWKDSTGSYEMMSRLTSFYETDYVFLMDSGRSAIYEVLKAFGIGPGDEVIVHAFSCLVVANPVVWAGAKPVFADVDPKDYNFYLRDLKKKITSKTKAIIVQHTFGVPEDVKQIRGIVGEKVIIIEDLAHALGGEFNKQKIGTFGDAAILTFGIEKVISSVRGGAAVIYNKQAGEKLEKEYASLPEFPKSMVKISLLNPIFWSITLPVYYLGIGIFTLGRALVFLGHKFGWLGRMIEKSEYRGTKPKWMPSKMSPVLAELAVIQWDKLHQTIKHRRELAQIYAKELDVENPDSTALLRFPVLVKNRTELLRKAKNHGIVLGDWYKKILYAPQETLDFLGYKKGMCPNAEKLKDQIINLPTNVNTSIKDAGFIAKLVKPYVLK